MLAEIIRVDLGNHQGNAAVHPESTAIVNDGNTEGSYGLGIVAAELPTRREKTDVGPADRIKRKGAHRDLPSGQADLPLGVLSRREEDQSGHGETAKKQKRGSDDDSNIMTGMDIVIGIGGGMGRGGGPKHRPPGGGYPSRGSDGYGGR